MEKLIVNFNKTLPMERRGFVILLSSWPFPRPGNVQSQLYRKHPPVKSMEKQILVMLKN